MGWSGGVWGSVNLATVSGLKRRTPSSSPPSSIIWAKRARSSAVENRPAWPATPPMLRAVGSWTTPRRGGPVLSEALGGGDARHQRGGGLEHGFLHAQRQEDVLAGIIGKHLAAEAVDDFAQQDEIDIAIDEARRPGGRRA